MYKDLKLATGEYFSGDAVGGGFGGNSGPPKLWFRLGCVSVVASGRKAGCAGGGRGYKEYADHWARLRRSQVHY